MIAELKDIDQKLEEVIARFPDEVVGVRYSTGHDWSGDPAVFFNIVLSDAASQRAVLGDVTQRLQRQLFDHLDFAHSDYIPYFDFRSKAERDTLKDPTWP